MNLYICTDVSEKLAAALFFVVQGLMLVAQFPVYSKFWDYLKDEGSKFLKHVVKYEEAYLPSHTASYRIRQRRLRTIS
jgi:hypothetical protein